VVFLLLLAFSTPDGPLFWKPWGRLLPFFSVVLSCCCLLCFSHSIPFMLQPKFFPFSSLTAPPSKQPAPPPPPQQRRRPLLTGPSISLLGPTTLSKNQGILRKKTPVSHLFSSVFSLKVNSVSPPIPPK